jgi:hypothetical protein
MATVAIMVESTKIKQAWTPKIVQEALCFSRIILTHTYWNTKKTWFFLKIVLVLLLGKTGTIDIITILQLY